MVNAPPTTPTAPPSTTSEECNFVTTTPNTESKEQTEDSSATSPKPWAFIMGILLMRMTKFYFHIELFH